MNSDLAYQLLASRSANAVSEDFCVAGVDLRLVGEVAELSLIARAFAHLRSSFQTPVLGGLESRCCYLP